MHPRIVENPQTNTDYQSASLHLAETRRGGLKGPALPTQMFATTSGLATPATSQLPQADIVLPGDPLPHS